MASLLHLIVFNSLASARCFAGHADALPNPSPASLRADASVPAHAAVEPHAPPASPRLTELPNRTDAPLLNLEAVDSVDAHARDVPALEAVVGIISGHQEASDVPGGHTREWLNASFAALIFSLAATAALGWVLEPLTALSKEGRPHSSVVGMLIASYILLALGVTQVLFAVRVSVVVMGFDYALTRTPDGKATSITESMLAVISELVSAGNLLGAMLLIAYGILIPGIKFVTLLLAESWRYSEGSRSRRCIRSVQMISKWACPDVFAYVLLLYLFRRLGDNSGFLLVPVQLDIGFMCFSLFCICSTMTTLLIPLPPMSDQTVERIMASPPLVSRWFGDKNLVVVVGALAVLFILVLVTGMTTPCMALHIDTTALVQPRGPLPPQYGDAIKTLHLFDNLVSEVTLWDCCKEMAMWIAQDGEANVITGFVMLAGFGVFVTVCDVVLLVAAAHHLGAGVKACPRSKLFQVAWVLKHSSMLDVCVMGMVVVVMASKVFEEQGVVLKLRSGVVWLFLAEVVHYAAYIAVDHAERYLEVRVAGDSRRDL